MLVDAYAPAAVPGRCPAGRLHHEHIRAAHVLLDLYVALAVGEARHLRLPARHPEKMADLVGQWLIRRAAEDLELLVHSRTLLPLLLLVGHRRTLFLNL